MLLLDIPSEIAEKDACYIEHGVHSETIEKIEKFVLLFKSCPELFSNWIKYLKKYYVSGEIPKDCR